MIRRALLLCLSALASACATVVPPPAVSERPATEPVQRWARVLERFVDAEGRVDFVALSQDRADLDHYVAWVYDNGPRTQPSLYSTPQTVLAYHLNAYNALAMYNVIESGIPETNAGFAKVKFFFLREGRVDGAVMSLHSYENDVIRKLGDARIHFALNCMSAGCPRLRREPYAAERVNAMLDEDARNFFAEPRNARVDETEKVVYLSEILDFFPEDFLAFAPTLTAYANLYRSPPLPEDYPVRYTPYDWTINRQPPR